MFEIVSLPKSNEQLKTLITKELCSLATESMDHGPVLLSIKNILDHLQKDQENYKITSDEMSELEELEASVLQELTSYKDKLAESESNLRSSKSVLMVVIKLLFGITANFVFYIIFDLEMPLWNKIILNGGTWFMAGLVYLVWSFFNCNLESFDKETQKAQVNHEQAPVNYEEAPVNYEEAPVIHEQKGTMDVLEFIQRQQSLVAVIHDEVKPWKEQSRIIENQKLLMEFLCSLLICLFCIVRIMVSVVLFIHSNQLIELCNICGFMVLLTIPAITLLITTTIFINLNEICLYKNT